jgi:hypothetical protein
MFLSSRFTGALADYYKSEYESLTIIVATIILLSCAYFLVVLSYEIWFLVNREAAERFVMCFNKTRSGKATAKAAAKSAKSSGDDAAAAAGGSRGRKAAAMELVQSPLMAKMVEEGKGGGSVTDDMIDQLDQPSAMQWAVIKLEFRRMRQQVNELQAVALQARVDAERDGSTGAGGGAAAALLSSRATASAAAPGSLANPMANPLASRARTRGTFGPMMANAGEGGVSSRAGRSGLSQSRRQLVVEADGAGGEEVSSPTVSVDIADRT